MRLLPNLCVACILLSTASAHAAGFYLLPRGTRGVGQGGAVVAGSDDPGALWYNPAGLAFSGKQVLFDLVLPYERFQFTRINAGGVTEPTIEANAVPLPIPGMGYSHPLIDDKLVMGIGLFAPTAALLDYPQGVVNPESNAVEYPPQGFSIMNMDGSALVFVGGGLAWRPVPGLSIGAGFNLLVGQFQAEVLASVSDPSLGPVSGEYSVTPAQFALKSIVRPTGTVGAVLLANELLGLGEDVPPIRIGLSFALPVTIQGDGTFDITLPSSGPFASAELSTNEIYMEMDFPWVARAGVEIRPTDELRTEVAFDYQAWGRQDAIRVETNLNISNVVGLGDGGYTVRNLQLDRNLQDTWSVRAGAEYTVRDWAVARIGAWFESSSMTDQTMSPLLPDSEKLGLSLGASFDVMDNLWLDALVGYMHMRDRNIPQGTNEIYRLEVVRPDLPVCGPNELGQGCKVPLGDGKYVMDTLFAGLGVRWVL